LADKKKSTEKIDNAIVAIRILDSTIRFSNDFLANVYDDRGILFI
jgi:hypothetical protein